LMLSKLKFEAQSQVSFHSNQTCPGKLQPAKN